MNKDYIKIKIKKYYIKFFLDLFFQIFFISFGMCLFKYFMPSDCFSFSTFMVSCVSYSSVIFGSYFFLKK